MHKPVHLSYWCSAWRCGLNRQTIATK